jgi:protocatechuate 3,4-dioxygenase beta subunit
MRQQIGCRDAARTCRGLARREALTLAGMLGSAMLAGCAPAATAATPTGTASALGATVAGVTSTPGTTASPTATIPSTQTPRAASSPSPTAMSAEAATAVAITPAPEEPTPGPAMANGCVARPAMTEGPYFVDEKLERSDIRSDPGTGTVKQGTPLALTFAVSQLASGACTPLAGAQVDVWHCDAEGVYSDVRDPRWNTVGQKFLRGYQLTDTAGNATFTTIVPGWYSGRAVHIHFKIRLTGGDGQKHDFTSQLFFDEAALAEVYAQQPYAARGMPDTSNARDSIYSRGGSQMLLALAGGDGSYSTTFAIALDLATT